MLREIGRITTRIFSIASEKNASVMALGSTLKPPDIPLGTMIENQGSTIPIYRLTCTKPKAKSIIESGMGCFFQQVHGST
jgi:hypothetical protein